MASKTKNSQTTASFFCDGACSGNPGPGGWAAVGWNPLEKKVWQAYGHEPESTNNRMELKAALKVLEWIEVQKIPAAKIHCDSKYVISGMEQWRFGWKKNNWQKADGEIVQNKELWQALDRQIEKIKFCNLQWIYVPGHQGVPGNEYVDDLAVAASHKAASPHEQSWMESDFQYMEIFDDLPLSEESPRKSKKSSSVKALGYLALIQGKVHEFATWPECEALVKGRSNVKYKKFTNAAEKVEILKLWGQN